MTEPKLIMGLDVSTSTIGISIFSDSGELINVTHISPIIKVKYDLKQDELWNKALLFKGFIQEKEWDKLPIGRIIIEEPLVGAKGTAHVAAQLNQFAGMVFPQLRLLFPDADIHYLSVDDARRNGLPELVVKGVLSWTKLLPKEINGRKISDYRKMAVWGQTTQRFPDMVWGINNQMLIDKKNFDKADSIVVAMGWMAKEWDISPMPLAPTIEFIQRYFDYEDEVHLITKDKKMLPSDKKDLKLKLFVEKYRLNDRIKFEI